MNEEKSGTMVATEQGSYYYHADHLGSSSVVTDVNGKFYEQIEYFPYGETWIHNKANTEQTSTPYKFTSKELDEETGLYYYGARYYDAKLSRWVSADDRFDGLYSTQGQNVYSYVHGRPVNYNDPTGHFDVAAVGEIQSKIDDNQNGQTYLGAMFGGDKNKTESNNSSNGNCEVGNKSKLQNQKSIQGVEQEEEWTAKGIETFNTSQMLLPSGDGFFTSTGIADVTFSNGKDSIRKQYLLNVTDRWGFSLQPESVSVNSTYGVAKFPKGKPANEVAESYSGDFYSKDSSIFILNFSTFTGGSWSGISVGVSEDPTSLGMPYSRTKSTTNYKIINNFSDVNLP